MAGTIVSSGDNKGKGGDRGEKVIWFEQSTHWKGLRFLERLRAEEEEGAKR